MVINLATFLCLAGPVLAALECTDWQGNTFAHGEELYPDKDDPCHMCLCDKGSLTMCKTVSCAPPNCQYLQKIRGKCCEFRCLTDTFENSTNLPPFDRDDSGSPSNATMTDLGLRLVASTVTTFLILALLLFLIHRLRQRRLMLALRRYSRRREPLDDSDDISYSPEFFGIQCPPYEDPPPPYSPPKPPHFRLGEQPPPYEAIDSNSPSNRDDTNGNTNNQNINRVNAANNSIIGANNRRFNSNITGNSFNSNRQESFQNGGSRLVPGGGEDHGEHIEMMEHVGSRATEERTDCNSNVRSVPVNGNVCDQFEHGNAQLQNSLNVHFRNSLVGLPSITMGVQNRGRLNRNRFSDGSFHQNRNFTANGTAAGLNLEIRNSVHGDPRSNASPNRPNFAPRYGEHSSSTTDIGESTTSAESLPSSPNFTPDSPETENETSTIPKSEMLSETFADDADVTVRQFLDRQFGRGSKARRYPTTMSQSWTSSQLNNTSTMPNFRQSISIGSFQPTHFDQSDQPTASGSSETTEIPRLHKQLPRSKSEHLKTNGSLRSQPYKGTVRTQPVFLPHTGFAARVSYVEPEIGSSSQQPKDNPRQASSQAANTSCCDSNVSECSASLSSSHPQVRVDPGDIIVTRRQDDLRELRLSHLLHNPSYFTHSMNMNSSSDQSSSVVNLQRSHSLNSVCSETGEKSLNGVALGNDVQYPAGALGGIQESQKASPAKHTKKTRTGCIIPGSKDINGNINTANARESSYQTGIKDADLSTSESSPVSNRQVNRVVNGGLMSMSWHGRAVESSDENLSSPVNVRTDTLGRNVNSNFAKKTCADKDVSNLCFPLFKPTNFESCNNANNVPSSGMRACASQLYNFETDDKLMKKEKKKHFLKRHSASCFPAKRENQGAVSHSPSRLTHKLKSSFSRERNERAGESISSDTHKKSNSKKSSRDRKSSSAERQSVNKSRQYFDDTNGVVTDLTPPCLIHANINPQLTRIDSKIPHGEGASVDVLNSSRQRGTRSARRSKSLGRCENIHSCGPTKQAELCPSHRSQARKKKNHSRGSFPGTHSFHQELEHVLGYSRRREPLDDSDDISYSPEFFGIQCPPYEDPPPPYSPPKPPHFRLGEQPPPYEAIDSNSPSNRDDTNGNTNNQNINRVNAANNSIIGANNRRFNSNITGNSFNSNRQESFQNGGSRLVPGGGEDHGEHIEMMEHVGSRATEERTDCNSNVRSVPVNGNVCDQFEHGNAQLQNSLNVHFRNSLVGLPSITMGVQNRGRLNRNRFSDGSFHQNRNFTANGTAAGLNLEIRNSVHGDPRSNASPNRPNFAPRYGEHSSSTTDIGESTTSAESLPSSPNFTPDSPETENETSTIPKSEMLSETFADDADVTVRQFLDRQFGRGSKARRYPTTMSQSWTSSQLNNTSTMPNFRQSISIGSFQPTHFDQSDQPTASGSSETTEIPRLHKQLPRSKSEHLKTNGSLRSQPYKGTVRTQPVFLPHTGFAARVSYVEPEIGSSSQQPKDNPRQASSQAANTSCCDSNVSECSASLSSSHPQVRVDPGDIIVTRRQDDLRELRLSHLLHNPSYFTHSMNMNSSSDQSSSVVNLQRSHSLNSVCSETGEKSLNGVALGNDVQYPAGALGGIQESQKASPAKHTKKTRTGCIIPGSKDINGNINTANARESSYQTGIKDADLSTSESSPVSNRQVNRVVNGGLMSMSWHGRAVESSDENLSSPVNVRTDTLGRNVNSNFAKKTCADKDVSNLCFPLFKPTNFESCNNANNVPSSGMRACASQLYNFETDDKLMKKEKKKHFLKRHSASCFPAKRENQGAVSHSPSRLTHKLKSSFSRERNERAGESISSDTHKKSNSKKSSRDRKSSSAERQSVNKSRQYFDDTNGVVTDLTPPCLIHANINPQLTRIDSKIPHGEGASVDVLNSSRQRGTRSARRSKSLGRCENIHSCGPTKQAELCPSHRSQARKKKNHSRGSFPGTHSFHQELEHVLGKQQAVVNATMNDHAVTRV